MENKTYNYIKIYKYILLTLVFYVGAVLGYHTFKIIEYYLKPVPNPLLPLDMYKYIAFPYLSFIPFLVLLLLLGIYLFKKNLFTKGFVFFYAILIFLFHIFQSSLLEFLNRFNPYG